MKSHFHCVQADIQDLGDRVDHIEDKLCDFAESFNTLVDSLLAHEDEITWLKFKVPEMIL